MKVNLPVTKKEILLDDNDVIVSSTDAKGVITSVNNDFLKISGFSEDELMGKAHNIVRHPDMPAAAFEGMWNTLKSGSPWMGIVKNRGKSGDYYWVDAFVTPLFLEGKLIGYESTRVKADPVRIRRAEQLYKKINKGRRLTLFSLGLFGKLVSSLVATILLVDSTLYFTAKLDEIQSLIFFLFSSAAVVVISKVLTRDLIKLTRDNVSQCQDRVSLLIYTGRDDELAQLHFQALFHKARMRTVLKLLEYSSEQLEMQSEQTVQSVASTRHMIDQQQQELADASESVNQVINSLQDVAGATRNTVNSIGEVTVQTRSGAVTVTEAIGIIENLSNEISNAEKVINRLSEKSHSIGSVLDVIRGIAEQTNLLALNAAIEAARAGEQGRGFAVVADEVRTLASRTQESTEEIRSMISHFQQEVGSTVAIMEKVRAQAGKGVEQVELSAEALAEISGAVQAINGLATQIASATEIQSEAVRRTGDSIQSIVQKNMLVVDNMHRADDGSEVLSDLSQKLNMVVNQFVVGKNS